MQRQRHSVEEEDDDEEDIDLEDFMREAEEAPYRRYGQSTAVPRKHKGGEVKEDEEDEETEEWKEILTPKKGRVGEETTENSRRMTAEEEERLGKSVGMLDVISMGASVSEPWRGDSAGQGRGSGWIYKWNEEDPRVFIVTCYHCVAEAMPDNGIKIKTASTEDKKIDGRVAMIMPEIDAAIVELMPTKGVDLKTLIPWELGDDKMLRADDAVKIYGYPLGQTKLKVIGSKMNGRQDGALQLDGAINPGHSGGPVVYDDKVVGWITSGIPGTNSISFAEGISMLPSAETLRELLPYNGPDETQKTVILRKGNLGISYFSGSEDRLMALGARAEVCTKGSPCQCESGIVLQWISQYSDLSKEPFNAEPGDIICSIKVTIPSGGKMRTFDLKINNEGEVSVPWSRERIDFNTLLGLVPLGKPISLNLWKAKDGQLIQGELKLSDTYKNGFYTPFYPYEKTPYEVFGGLVVDQMNSEVLANFPRLGKSMLLSEAEKPKVIIVDVFPSSEMNNPPVLGAGLVVKSVNGKPVTTISEYREALFHPLEGKDGVSMLLVVTERDRSQLVPMKKIMAAEDKLADSYKYPLSDTYRKLKERYGGRGETETVAG